MSDASGGAGWVRRIEAGLEGAIKAIIGILLAGMVTIVFMNVIFRYFLNSSIAWSEEVSRFMFIWLCFLGANIAFIKNEHLGLDLLLKVLPAKAAEAIQVLADLLVMGAILILVVGGFDVTLRTLESGWTSPATETPYGLIYAIVPFSAVVLELQGLVKLVDHVRILARPAKAGA